jgi:hypothetical protein
MDWHNLIQTVGFPIVSTVALAVVVYRIANIFYFDVYAPQQKKHYDLVDKLEKSLDRICDSQDKVVTLIDRVMDKLEEHEERISKIEQKVT